MRYSTIEDTIGNTPLVRIQRLLDAYCLARGNVVLAKLEGNNPAGSVKDRAAMAMITHAELRGEIKPGDTLIEATSGNTGIALAMAAAIKGYKMVLIMPDDLSVERRAAMAAYGAQILLTPSKKSARPGQKALVGMEYARDLAMLMQQQGKGKVLDQFSNSANPGAHISGTGPEIWQQTEGQITHFVSAMGTTGTITGVSTYLKSMNSHIQTVGVQPQEGAHIPGIRKWPQAYLPRIYDPEKVDRIEYVSQGDCEVMVRRLATQEGIFCGPSAAGAFTVALKIAQALENATIVFIVCDRGDRYLSTGIYEAQ